MENPIKMDDLGVPPFEETPIYIYSFLKIIADLSPELETRTLSFVWIRFTLDFQDLAYTLEDHPRTRK